MKRLLPVILTTLVFAASARADDQLRTVQQALKDQGFYYGEVDGEEGSETNAAVRRFQIRNGLQVTGKLNAEVLASLGFGPAPAPQQQSRPQTQPPAPSVAENQDVQPVRPQPQTRPRSTITENDKNFLRQQPPVSAAPATPPADDADTAPPPAVTRAPDLAAVFQRTPYERAPIEVQHSTLRRAQTQLFRQGYYRGAIDGEFGPETQRAIKDYQLDADLPATGQLDMRTLADMNLLPPTRRVVVPLPGEPFDRWQVAPPPVVGHRVYRGIWIR